jgi:hypothetical protein
MAVAFVEAFPLLFNIKVTFLQSAVGATLSMMEIILETVAKVLPQASVAVQVSVADPLQLLELLTTMVDKFEVPLIKQPPDKPFVKDLVLGVGSNVPQVTVILDGASIVGKAAGVTVITRETELIVRPQLSVAVQVSVTVPPHALGSVLKVEGLDVPDIKQPPLKTLL